MAAHNIAGFGRPALKPDEIKAGCVFSHRYGSSEGTGGRQGVGSKGSGVPGLSEPGTGRGWSIQKRYRAIDKAVPTGYGGDGRSLPGVSGPPGPPDNGPGRDYELAEGFHREEARW